MKVLALATEKRIFALRKRGLSLRKIGRMCGRSHVAVLRILQIPPARRRAWRRRYPTCVKARFKK